MWQVSKKAGGLLADSLLMGYMLSVISRQGKIWTQDDHANRYLDGKYQMSPWQCGHDLDTYSVSWVGGAWCHIAVVTMVIWLWPWHTFCHLETGAWCCVATVTLAMWPWPHKYSVQFWQIWHWMWPWSSTVCICVTDMIQNVAMQQYFVYVCDRYDTDFGHGAILCIMCVWQIWYWMWPWSNTVCLCVTDTVCGHGAILCIICVTDMILNVAMEQYYVYVCDRSDTKCGHGTVLWSTEVQGQDTAQQTSEETAWKGFHWSGKRALCVFVVVPVFVCSMTVCLCVVRPVFVCGMTVCFGVVRPVFVCGLICLCVVWLCEFLCVQMLDVSC